MKTYIYIFLNKVSSNGVGVNVMSSYFKIFHYDISRPLREKNNSQCFSILFEYMRVGLLRKALFTHPHLKCVRMIQSYTFVRQLKSC